MKTIADVKNRLTNELLAWMTKQANKPHTASHLYYLAQTVEHNSGLLICAAKPANQDYELVRGEAISGFKTINQHLNYFLPMLNRLPILDQ